MGIEPTTRSLGSPAIFNVFNAYSNFSTVQKAVKKAKVGMV